jgi:hypothetical protein
MSLRMTKTAAAAASALVLTLGVAGCGGDDGASSSPKSATSEKSSASSPAGGDLTPASFVDTVVSAQQKARTSHMEMVIDAGGQKVTATGDQITGKSGEDSAAAMTMDYGSVGLGTIKVTIVDGQVYMNFGEMTGGKYAKVDLTDPDDPFTRQIAPMMEQLDTAKQIESLGDALVSVEKKGDPETIDGVEAQPYAVEVEPAKMDAVKALPPAARETLPKTVTYTMFLGPDDLLRRMTYGFGGTTGEVTLSQWGEPLDIEAPPADEVSEQDLSTLLQNAAA